LAASTPVWVKGNSRDPSAILVGGFNRMTGILDVVEARIKKRLPSVIISDTIALQRQYGCLCWSVEAVQFQEFLRTELVRQSAELGSRCRRCRLSALRQNPAYRVPAALCV
jgi:predicted phage terminase large subunit-like protein